MGEENVIFAYTDEMAVADGVLVPFSGSGRVNRITQAVYLEFTDLIGQTPLTGKITDVTRLRAAIDAALAVVPDRDGWRTLTFSGKRLWLVPNEVGGFTLMFPEDY
jgi:hypothetical protein